MIVLGWLVGLVVVAFAFVVLRGAPYVPTHRAQILHALDMFKLPAGSTIVDLGSGDGAFLKAAAARGYCVIGYELNPFLCVVSVLRCWRYRQRVKVVWRDFWLTPLPPETDGVFVFLAGPYLKRLNKKLAQERNPQRPLVVISYGFLIPGKGQPERTEQALHRYRY